MPTIKSRGAEVGILHWAEVNYLDFVHFVEIPENLFLVSVEQP